MNLLGDKRVRYLISGISAFIVEFIVFWILLVASHHLIFANTVAFIIGVIAGFMFHKYWSFAGEHRLGGKTQLVATSLMGVCNLIFATLCIEWLVTQNGVNPYIAKCIVICAIIVWNYTLFTKLVFRLLQKKQQQV